MWGLKMFVKDLEVGFNEWTKDLKLQRKAVSTIDQYKRGVRQFFKYLKENNINEIDFETIIDYENYLNSLDIKTSTFNVRVTALNLFLSYVGFYSDKTNKYKAKTKTVQKTEFKECMSTDEYTTLVKYARDNKNNQTNYRNYLLMRVLGETGIRISELKYFTVPSLKKINGKLQVENKGKIRNVLIPAELKQELLEYAEENNITNYIFYGSKRDKVNGKVKIIPDYNKPLDRTVIWKNLKRLAKRAGINEDVITPHLFRHRYSLTYLENNNKGQALKNLGDILGHSSLNTTRYYLEQSEEDLIKTVTDLYTYDF